MSDNIKQKGGRRPGSGRKRKTNAGRHVVSVRLDGDAFAGLQGRAKRRRKTIGAAVKELLLSALKREPPPRGWHERVTLVDSTD